MPGVATTKEEVLAVGRQPLHVLGQHAGPRRGRSSAGSQKLALVGMSCQSSVPPVMWHRKVGKVGKPFVFNIGLLCSKTFDDAIFEELFEAKYGLHKQDMVKMNIKGVFQIWMQRRRATTRSTSRSATPGPARAATTAPTSPPSTPTSPPAASASTTTGRSPSCAPTSAARSSAGMIADGVDRSPGPATTTPAPSR